MPIPYQLFTYRNRKSSNSIPAEIKLEDSSRPDWIDYAGTPFS